MQIISCYAECHLILGASFVVQLIVIFDADMVCNPEFFVKIIAELYDPQVSPLPTHQNVLDTAQRRTSVASTCTCSRPGTTLCGIVLLSQSRKCRAHAAPACPATSSASGIAGPAKTSQTTTGSA